MKLKHFEYRWGNIKGSHFAFNASTFIQQKLRSPAHNHYLMYRFFSSTLLRAVAFYARTTAVELRKQKEKNRMSSRGKINVCIRKTEPSNDNNKYLLHWLARRDTSRGVAVTRWNNEWEFKNACVVFMKLLFAYVFPPFFVCWISRIGGWCKYLSTLTSHFSDINQAHKNRQICSLIGVEGGHSLGGSLGVLRTFYSLGVRYMTLTSTCHTPWADSSNADAPKYDVKHGGLTSYGKVSQLFKCRQELMNNLCNLNT